MTGRTGRDNSFIELPLLPFLALGLPVWLPLVILYFAGVFTLGWLWPDFRAATWFAALGPGVIGLIDLLRRLRTRHYQWEHPQAGVVVTSASLVDRLTFRECGWYLHLVFIQLPLWVVGLALSAAFLRTWTFP
ncbi:MAG: hypothetical protein ACM31D_04065 [Bacteroidota bacterium]